MYSNITVTTKASHFNANCLRVIYPKIIKYVRIQQNSKTLRGYIVSQSLTCIFALDGIDSHDVLHRPLMQFGMPVDTISQAVRYFM